MKPSASAIRSPRPSLRTPGTEKPTNNYDRSAAAIEILNDSAESMADGLIAVAQVSPDGAVVLNNVVVAASTPSTGGYSITFPCNGFIVAIAASAQDGTLVSQYSTSLRVQQNGDTDVFQAANGGGAGYMPFFQISGNNQGKLPIRRRFEQATQWQVYFQNVQTAQVVCDVTFYYVNTSNPRV